MSWTGAQSRKARAKHAPAVRAGAAICCRCGRPILPGQAWHADHYPIALEHGGTETQPAHAHCNTRAGGLRGAQLTNAKRINANRGKNIRGI